MSRIYILCFSKDYRVTSHDTAPDEMHMIFCALGLLSLSVPKPELRGKLFHYAETAG